MITEDLNNCINIKDFPINDLQWKKIKRDDKQMVFQS